MKSKCELIGEKYYFVWVWLSPYIVYIYTMVYKNSYQATGASAQAAVVPVVAGTVVQL